MSAITDAFNTAFRNYVVDGDPSSGVNNPNKAQIRAIGPVIDAAITAALVPGGGSLNSMPAFLRACRNYIPGTSDPIMFVGFGESIAQLPDLNGNTSVQALVAVFEEKMNQGDFPPYQFASSNYSVGGSIISEFPGQWATMLGAGVVPTVCLLQPGANDFEVTNWNGGQAKIGFSPALMDAIATIKQYGADVIILTTHLRRVYNADGSINYTEMPVGLDMTWPTFVAAPVPGADLVPPDTESINTGYIVPGFTTGVALDVRFQQGNDMILEAAASAGVLVFRSDLAYKTSLATLTESSSTQLAAEAILYGTFVSDPTNYIHPSPTGMSLSHTAAIVAGVTTILANGIQNGGPERFNGSFVWNGDPGSNGSNPVANGEAYHDFYPRYGDDSIPPMRGWSATGSLDVNLQKTWRLCWKINETTGQFETARVSLGVANTDRAITLNTTNASGFEDAAATLNTSVDGTVTFPDNSGGTMRLRALQSGVAKPQLIEFVWATKDGVLYIDDAANHWRWIDTGTPALSGTTLTGGTLFNFTVSGLVMTVAVTAFVPISLYVRPSAW